MASWKDFAASRARRRQEGLRLRDLLGHHRPGGAEPFADGAGPSFASDAVVRVRR